MPTSESFDDLIGRLRAADDDAAAEIFHRFASRLIQLARKRISSRMRAKVDPESIAQSVFCSFFRRQAEGQFELEGWDSLWGLLARITVRKCGHRIEAFQTRRRDVRREIVPAATDPDSRRQWEAIAREPSPQEAAMLIETVEGLMSGLNEKQQEVVALRLQAYTVPEISWEVGRTERTVHRALSLARDVLTKMELRASL